MGILNRKLRRDLGRRRGQVAAVVLTVFLGIVLFGASYDAFLNLQTSYRSLYDDLRFADYTVESPDAEGIATQGADLEGVRTTEVRRVADVPMRIGGDHEMLGRVVGVPATAQPAINRLMLLEGDYLNPAQEGVLVEQHMAEHFGLAPGDAVEVLGEGGWVDLPVQGVVATPEYLWPARSRQEILTSLDDFGVLFAPGAFVEALPAQTVTEETLFLYEEGAEAAATDARVESLLEGRVTGAAYPQDEQPSNAALQEDVQGFSDLSFMFPLLFLGAAGMATYILLTRLVYSQQGIIGLLRASGMGGRTLFGHYLVYGLVVGLAGSLPGIAVGILLGRLITGFYTAEIAVPVTVVEFHPLTLLLGPLFGLVAGALSALAPALRAVRMPPGAAMRGPLARGTGGMSLLERIFPPARRLPARAKLVLRGIGRNKRRSASTVMGVILALTLILVSWGMLDTIEILLDRQYDQIQRSDAQLYFEPASLEGESPLEAVSRVEGVEAAESIAEIPVTLEAPSAGGETRRYSTQLGAYPRDTGMREFLLEGGDTAPLPEEGIYGGVALRDELGLEVGDEVTVLVPSTGAQFAVPLSGFIDEPLGTLAFTSQEYLSGEIGLDTDLLPTSVLVRYAEGAERDDMRARLTAVPGVAAFVDSRALVETIRSFMGLFYAVVGVMLVFGAVMAFALIFNTMAANISERSTEIATLKAAGVGRRSITALITAENILLTLLAIAPGLVLGYGASWLFMNSYTSDLFRFDLHVRPSTFALTSLAIVFVALVSQWPILRVVARLDVARVVRERAV